MARYKITLTKEERKQLQAIINKGKHTAKYKSAYILLNCDRGKHTSGRVTNEQICKVLQVGMRTIDRLKKRFVEEGFEAALQRKPSKRVYQRKIDGEVEAKLIALYCSDPPEGYNKWTLRLLRDKIIELKYLADISHVAIHKVLKKTNLSRGR